MKIRVLFLRTDPATIDPRIQKEAGSLKDARYDVHVFGWDRRRQFSPRETIQDVKYVRSRIPGPYASKLLAFVLPAFWIHAIIRICKLKPAVVHACDLDAFVPALLGRLFRRYSIVYDIFDNFAEKIINLPNFLRHVIRKFDRNVMRRADVVIVPDDSRKAMLVSPDPSRVEIIMNVPPRTNYSREIPREPFRICSVGSIQERRGLNFVASAVSGISGVETVFAGPIPSRQDAEFLAGQKSIRYVGQIPYQKALELVANSHVSLALYDTSHPIYAMASSNKVFEAMSLRRPVISNYGTTMEPIVSRENCGLLVNYGDIDEFREAVLRLRDDRALCDELGDNGYQAFEERYNWDIMSKRLVEIYSRLTGSSGV
jgi:glycosyltransferase involved in cell wall biosynthesis